MARDITHFLVNKFSSLLEEAREYSKQHSIGVPLMHLFSSFDRTTKSHINSIWNLEDRSVLEMNRILHDVIDLLSECLLLARQKDGLKKKLFSQYSIRKRESELSLKQESFIDLAKSQRSQEDRQSRSSFLLDQITTASSPHPDEKPVGVDKDATDMKRRVSNRGRLNALGIVGMGGSGKTTLARKVFEKIKSRFDITMWISLSETRNDQVDIRADLVKHMLNLVGFEVDQFPFEYELFELLKILKTQLEGKRYLLVLDDVWNVDEWYANLGEDRINEDKLSNGLPIGNGSVVIVTTRIEYVATTMVGGNNIFSINKLSDEAICSIISKRFHRRVERVIKKMKADIIEYCDGLPFIAKALGDNIPRVWLEEKANQRRRNAGLSEHPRVDEVDDHAKNDVVSST